MILENNKIKLQFSETGSLISFLIKDLEYELITDTRLSSSFRMLVPMDDYLCNYVDGNKQLPKVSVDNNMVTFTYDGLISDKGYLDINFISQVELKGNTVTFHSKTENHSDLQIAEIWYPIIGGINYRNAKLQIPENNISEIEIFKSFPGGMPLGGEAAEFYKTYPGMSMPWIRLKDNDNSLYMGYHDSSFRFSMFLFSLYPNISGISDSWIKSNEPTGVVFSHIRFPYLSKHDVLDSGSFVIEYNKEMDINSVKKESWMAKPRTWLARIPYEEGKVINKYSFSKYFTGDICYEFVRLPLGNLDEETMYNRFDHTGLSKLTDSIHKTGGRIVVPITFNLGDVTSDFYKKDFHSHRRMDAFEDGINFYGYGTSRTLSLSNKVYDTLRKTMINLVKCGIDGIILDKLTQCSTLDLNKNNKYSADMALCEGLVNAISSILAECKEINPDFCLGGDMVNDRLIQYFDMLYVENTTVFDVMNVSYINSIYDVHKIDETKIRLVGPNLYNSVYKGEPWQNAIKKLGGTINETRE